MIRVLLVDDQALVRSGFRVILETQQDIEVIGEAENGLEAVELAAELTPDVICMDVEMPQLNGIEASRQILTAAANPKNSLGAPAILVLTTFGHEEYIFDALAAGVSGFLLKTSRAEQLVDAVRTLAAGGALLGPDVTRAVMQRVSAQHVEQPGAVPQPSRAAATDGTTSHGEATSNATAGLNNTAAMDAAGLTDREREVLALVATGRSNGEIAIELFLGAATVKTHVSNLLQKLGARDRVQLVVWAHTIGAEVL
ncbi:response regulator transcription factor [Leucobacter sp. UT-8R-CII-1-4]|uniref:response regulator n=1 Tax=Leucobacter sp. UT-8R-CII-1-4 TaxID=3040075 RepID=UPI0024A92DE1|nr:response regulator transcription factor [Leucobacter sp. UT-8R-CII-1-4]MDI6023573.1 response regulator transcription factor [Leucobacter sp. UT-8R-CII-1-4]